MTGVSSGCGHRRPTLAPWFDHDADPSQVEDVHPVHPTSTTRRTFLGSLTAAAMTTAALPSIVAAEAGTKATGSEPKARNPFVYRFDVGDIEAWSISDGHMLFREGLNLMWPEQDRTAMREDLERHGERTDGLPLYVNILVARIGNEIALFDAGFGPRPNNREIGWVADALASIGLKPEQVTQAFLSHAHADHLGGFVAGNKATFANAAVHCLKAEVDFWRSPEPDFSRSRRAKGPLPNMIKDARNKFDVLSRIFSSMRAARACSGVPSRLPLPSATRRATQFFDCVPVANHCSISWTWPIITR